MTNGRGDPNNATLFINLVLFREAFVFNEMGYGAAIAWLLFVDRPGADARALRVRPRPRLLRGRRAMTATARGRGSPRFSDGGPVARTYRRFLGQAMLTLFAVVIISAFLLPLLYMVTTAFQQPGQRRTPGAPV